MSMSSPSTWDIFSIIIQTPTEGAGGEKCGPEGYTCLNTGLVGQCGDWLGYKDFCCVIGLQSKTQVINVPCSYIPGLRAADIEDSGFPVYNHTGTGCLNNDHAIYIYGNDDGGSVTTECCRTLYEVEVIPEPDGHGETLGCGDWTGIVPSAEDITNGGGTVPPGGAGTPASATNGGGGGSSPTSAGSNNPSQTSGSNSSTQKPVSNSPSQTLESNPSQTSESNPSQTSGTGSNSGGNGGSTTTPASKSTPGAASSNFQKVTSLVLGTAALAMFIGAQI